jgi:hypothetical protein
MPRYAAANRAEGPDFDSPRLGRNRPRADGRQLDRRSLAWLRRDLIRIGAAGGLHLWGLSAGLARASSAIGARPPATSCIMIWLDGGPSHLDSFDPKPSAPLEVRGPFDSIGTSLVGVRLSSLLPQLAQRLSRTVLVRSMTSPLGEHDLATRYLWTGFRPTPVLDYPVLGSVLAQQLADSGAAGTATDRFVGLPPFVSLPSLQIGGTRLSGHGFMPSQWGPFATDVDPGKLTVPPQLTPAPGLSAERLQRRFDYRQLVDRVGDGEAGLSPADQLGRQALELLTNDTARQAFHLESEPEAIRQRYGSREPGPACLLARRLIERGVTTVTVNVRGWDTHDDLVTRLRDGYTGAAHPVGLLPSLDSAVAALMDDLVRLDLFDSTLVVVMGEFGRTPRINSLGGRDHWPRVFSSLLFGGGIQAGQVIGSSDSLGESPRQTPVTPEDLIHSIYVRMGIAPDTTLITPDGRPVTITAPGSRPIPGLLA